MLRKNESAMKIDTAIGSKLSENGILPRNVELQIAIAKFMNNGGEYGVALAILNAAYGRGKVSHVDAADKVVRPVPSSSPTNAAKGHSFRAEKAKVVLPEAATQRNGDGRAMIADKASAKMLSSVSTEREREGLNHPADKADNSAPSSRNFPGHARRGAVAIASIQPTMAKSLFDTVSLPDGRKLRDVRWNECPALATKYRRLSRILMAVHGHAIPESPSTTIDNVVNEQTLKEIIAAVEKFNDIH